MADTCLRLGWETKRKEIAIDVVEQAATLHELELPVASGAKSDLSLSAVNLFDSARAATRGQL